MDIRRLLLGLFLLCSALLSGCNYPARIPEAPSNVAPSTGTAPGAPTVSTPSTDEPTADPNANPPASSPDSPQPAIPEIDGLVEVIKLDDTLVIDLRYATEDNFTGKKIYTQAKCLLVKGTAEKLVAANQEFTAMGYRLKIWDAYRPLSAQQTLWDVVSDRSFVADPKKGSIHNRGAAVDVTLVDKDGKELPMPSEFDDFSERASITYTGCTEEQAKNRELLAEVMVRNGFRRLETEWWHFTDSESSQYPLLDVQFEEFK